MVLFPTFAILIWWPTAVYRRRWQSFAIVFAGVTLLALLGAFHAYLGSVTNYTLFVPVFQSIWIPYAVLVGAIGLLIAIMPRRYSGAVCESCGYPDDGLQAVMRCPECGRKRVNRPIDNACALCQHDLTDLPRRGTCPGCEGFYAKPATTTPKTGTDWFSGKPGGVSYEQESLGPDDEMAHTEPALSPDQPEAHPDQQDRHRQARDEHPAEHPAGVR